jgi:hypothetical protein
MKIIYFNEMPRISLSFSNPAGLVNSWLAEIDRCRATHLGRELRNECVKECLHLGPFGVIGVPFVLFFQGRLFRRVLCVGKFACIALCCLSMVHQLFADCFPR